MSKIINEFEFMSKTITSNYNLINVKHIDDLVEFSGKLDLT